MTTGYQIYNIDYNNRKKYNPLEELYPKLLSDKNRKNII